jgi:tRNA (mo5U34)-methyltransferase
VGGDGVLREQREAALPTDPDDPRLSDWYHTIELSEGLVTRGFYDHRPVLHRYGLPASMEGMTALDVGTADGFFAFEMEKRGARVVATDVRFATEWDVAPRIRSRFAETDHEEQVSVPRFRLAHAMRSSSVEHRFISVYDLSPEVLGTFDLVFCGSLLLHLQNPLKALCAIRSVTGGMAVIETSIDPHLERERPDLPGMRYGARELEDDLGLLRQHWQFTTRALEDMLAYAGFAATEPRGVFELPPTELVGTVVAAYPSLPSAEEAQASPQLRSLTEGVAGLRAECEAMEAESRRRAEAYEGSRSWRLTQPLRRLAAGRGRRR